MSAAVQEKFIFLDPMLIMTIDPAGISVLNIFRPGSHNVKNATKEIFRSLQLDTANTLTISAYYTIGRITEKAFLSKLVRVIMRITYKSMIDKSILF